ncbi:MAG: response regulator [Candidatus Binatota bacterium]|nr:response regulator [Candidatus Binatota bacterium]
MARVLLIEPDRVLAETYSKALTAAGHQVVTRAGAQAAITAADQAQPDLVILELQLVGHSGIEFLYEFRSYPEWQAVPVLVHSSVPPAEFAGNRQLLEQELGVNDYLYKPRTSLRQLAAAVEVGLAVKA